MLQASLVLRCTPAPPQPTWRSDDETYGCRVGQLYDLSKGVYKQAIYIYPTDIPDDPMLNPNLYTVTMNQKVAS